MHFAHMLRFGYKSSIADNVCPDAVGFPFLAPSRISLPLKTLL